MLKQASIFALPIVMLLGVFATSCEKPSAPQAEIQVTDTLGAPVEGATVRVSCQSTDAECDLITETREEKESYLEDVTNYSGMVYFDFENPALLQVDASYTDPVTSVTMTGSDVIKLQEGEDGEHVTELTIVIQ